MRYHPDFYLYELLLKVNFIKLFETHKSWLRPSRGTGRRYSIGERLIEVWSPERTKAEGGAWMKEAGDLHFRITGESDKCWNNSLSY